MKYILFLLVFVLGCTSTTATTFYVDANAGSDAADGRSAATAWRSLAKAGAQIYAPGDSLLLSRGSRWREQLTVSASGTSSAPITIGSYGTATTLPVITGSNRITGWQHVAGSIWKAPCGATPNIVSFCNLFGTRRTAMTDLIAERNWYWSVGILYIFSATDPSQKYASPCIEAGARDYCIYAQNRSHLRINNLHLEYANRSCLRANGVCSDLTLTSVDALGAGDQAGYEFDAVTNITLDRCIARFCRSLSVGDGFMFKGSCRNVTLKNCTAAYNRRRGGQFDTGIGGYIHILGGEYHHQYSLNQSDGISIDACNGVLIEGAWCHDNGINNDSADGIQISGNSLNPVVRYCRCENNYNGGIILQSDGGTIEYNISTGNRHGVAVCGNPTQTLTISNNTCYQNEFGLFFYEITPQAPVNVLNNIFFGSDAKRRAAHMDAGLSDIKINMNYNCFWGLQNSYAFEWGGLLYTLGQFKLWQSVTRHNPQSICADPRFVNATGRDFRLQSGSPCIGKGTAMSMTRDFSGNPVPASSPDIGALEYMMQ